MKQISSSDFRRKYATLSEPTEVLAFDALIGTWIPRGSSLAAAGGADFTLDGEQPSETGPESETRMSIRPVHGAQRRLVGRSKTIMDPISMRDQARARDNEMTPRQFIRKS
jgi:hypothetical protein